MEITTANLLTATSGRETLLVRFDGTKAHLSIDENDNGTVVSVSGSRDLLDSLCKGLGMSDFEEGERRSRTLLRDAEAAANLAADTEGYELALTVIGERQRTFRCSLEDGATLRKAIRGTFGFWD
jgi:hypothetical protein